MSVRRIPNIQKKKKKQRNEKTYVRLYLINKRLKQYGYCRG